MPDNLTADVSAEMGAAEAGSEGIAEATTLTDVEATPTETTTESVAEALFEIDGTPITLDEARNGYLRQADYTRKTQEVAERARQLSQYEALATALETNPRLAMEAIAEATGFQVVPKGQNPAAVHDDVDYSDLDPSEARIAQLEAKIAAQEERERMAAIDSEMQTLKSTYGDFDEQALLTHAIRTQASSLTDAFRTMKFADLEAELAELKSAKEAQAEREAAKSAAQVVHSTTGVRGAQPAPEAEVYGGIREAFEAAKKQLGLT